MSTVELIVIERAGQRLAIPSAQVSMIGALPRGSGAVSLQERLGQPPLEDGERCVAIAIRTTEGPEIVSVAGRVTIAQVDAAEIASLPPLLAGVGPVAAVVFGDEVPVLVLDVDATVVRGRAEQ